METMQFPETSRLQIELLSEQDAHLLHELDQDPEVMRFINGGEPSSMEFIEETYLPRLRAFSNPEEGWGLWKVIEKQSASFIGWILVRPLDFFSDKPTQLDNLELGWRFKRDSWGKGYATEAAQVVLDELKKNRENKYFSALADEENTGSINIMKKLGMDYLKTDICKDPLGDMSVVYYQMANPNYQAPS